MRDSGSSLYDLKQGMPKYPQPMINVPPLAKRFDLDDSAPVQRALAAARQELLRPSGTEPVVRVMVEGRDSAMVERLAAGLAAVAAVASRGGRGGRGAGRCGDQCFVVC